MHTLFPLISLVSLKHALHFNSSTKRYRKLQPDIALQKAAIRQKLQPDSALQRAVQPDRAFNTRSTYSWYRRRDIMAETYSNIII